MCVLAWKWSRYFAIVLCLSVILYPIGPVYYERQVTMSPVNDVSLDDFLVLDYVIVLFSGKMTRACANYKFHLLVNYCALIIKATVVDARFISGTITRSLYAWFQSTSFVIVIIIIQLQTRNHQQFHSGTLTPFVVVMRSPQ